MKNVWKLKRILKQYGILLINAIWKQKENLQDTQTYRSISVEHIIVNVQINIALTRLSLFYQCKPQFGFRSVKWYNDCIYLRRQRQ